MRFIDQYRDKWRLLVTREKDGGDTAFFTAHYFVALAVMLPSMRKFNKQEFEKALMWLRVPGKKGNYRRHPDPAKWYSAGNVMSRDQMTGLIVAMGLYGLKSDLLWSCFRWVTRLGFMTNTRRNGSTKANHGEVFNGKGDRRNYNWKLPDWAPTFLGLYVRALRVKPLWPLLFVLDLELLLSAIKKIWWPSTSGDDHNFISRLWQAKEEMPTPVSRAARWCYGKRKRMERPIGSEYEPSNGPQSAILFYASRGNYKYPPLDQAWKSILDNEYGREKITTGRRS